MRTLIALTFFFSIYAYSQTKQEIQETSKKLKMDYGDQQLLMRDVCRKPIEYLETRYSNVPKDKLLKMKEKCDK
jgi:FMN-dependent NADH-azoreductase